MKVDYDASIKKSTEPDTAEEPLSPTFDRRAHVIEILKRKFKERIQKELMNRISKTESIYFLPLFPRFG